jgi:hypothetical protein
MFGVLVMVIGFLSLFFVEPQLASFSDRIQVARGTAGAFGLGAGMLILSMVIWQLEKQIKQLKSKIETT